MAARGRKSPPRRRGDPREETPGIVPPVDAPTATPGEGLRGSAEDEARWGMALVASAGDAILAATPDGRIVGWNREAERLYGYTAAEAIGRPLAMLCPPDRLGEPREFLDRVGRGQVVRQIETLRVRKDGREAEVGLTVSPVRDAAGRILGASVIAHDIGGRKRAEAALRESEERLRLVSENIPVHVWICDPDGHILYCNRRMADYVGGPADRLLGRGWESVIHPEDQATLWDAWGRAVREGGEYQARYRVLGADGRYRWFLARAFPLRDPGGAIDRWYGTNTDIDETIRAERALRENEERLRLAMQVGKTLAFEWDAATDEVGWSENRADILGVPADLTPRTGAGFFALVHPDDRESFLAVVRAITPSSPDYQITYRFLRPGGGATTLAETGRGFFDPGGRLVRVVGVSADVTEQKRAEQALRESEGRLRAIVDTAADGIITIDDRGAVVAFNAAAERMFGYRAGEVLGREVNLLMPSPHREQHGRYLARYRETGQRRVIGTVRELVARRRDGTAFPIELSVSEVDELGLFTGIVRDISERKAFQEELLLIAEAEQRRIGQDLHDDVGQELMAMGLLVEALVEALDEGRAPVAAGVAARIRARLARVQERTRALTRGLIPVQVDARGLMAALEELTENIGTLHGIACTFECRVPVSVEDNRAATHLYRITQEAITNAVKHGRVRHIHVGLRGDEGRIHLEIRDDGIGIPDELRRGVGMGLKIMRYRANLIGARLEIGRAAGGGTRVGCSIAGGNDHGRRRDGGG